MFRLITFTGHLDSFAAAAAAAIKTLRRSLLSVSFECSSIRFKSLSLLILANVIVAAAAHPVQVSLDTFHSSRAVVHVQAFSQIRHFCVFSHQSLILHAYTS